MITDWQVHRSISRKAKWLATGSMTLCAVILIVFSPLWWVTVISCSIMAAVGTWIWFRPEINR